MATRNGLGQVMQLEAQPVQSQWGHPWAEPTQGSRGQETRGPSSEGRPFAADIFRVY